MLIIRFNYWTHCTVHRLIILGAMLLIMTISPVLTHRCSGGQAGLTDTYKLSGTTCMLSSPPETPRLSLQPWPQEFLLFCGCLLSHFSHAWLFVTQWPVACQAPLSMGFSRQENWSGLPFPRPEDLPNPGIKPMSLDISCIGEQILYP